MTVKAVIALKRIAETEPKLYAYIAPATPAMNELIPNAAIFVRATLMPTAAAARSLERTASMRCPRPLRRRFATNRQATIVTERIP